MVALAGGTWNRTPRKTRRARPAAAVVAATAD
jgi:hypothetical protein